MTKINRPLFLYAAGGGKDSDLALPARYKRQIDHNRSNLRRDDSRDRHFSADQFKSKNQHYLAADLQFQFFCKDSMELRIGINPSLIYTKYYLLRIEIDKE